MGSSEDGGSRRCGQCPVCRPLGEPEATSPDPGGMLQCEGTQAGQVRRFPHLGTLGGEYSNDCMGVRCPGVSPVGYSPPDHDVRVAFTGLMWAVQCILSAPGALSH